MKKSTQSAEYLVLLGMISQMTPEEQAKISSVHGQLKAIVDANGEEGVVALCKLGLELQDD